MQLEYDLASKTQTELSYSAYLSRKYGVTRRESQLMELILHGKNNKEIADSLKISDNTVKKHIGHLFQKLQVTNRVQLIHKVIEEEGVECQIF
ncbi:MAG: LuxR family transcriptional regulator [Anaerocolumna sp.]|nr:LuxR family transcriptional regulator [Anaerocolumna sp.]